MAVTTIVQTTQVDDIGMVTVSEIIQDPDTNQWVRVIQVFKPPNVLGDSALQFTLRLLAETKGAVELSAPAVHF